MFLLIIILITVAIAVTATAIKFADKEDFFDYFSLYGKSRISKGSNSENLLTE